MLERDLATIRQVKPGDPTFGSIPAAVHADLRHQVHRVQFDKEVWYNRSYRDLAYGQIRGFQIRGETTLVGFSKSGLGAINICLDHPGEFSAVVVFDSPLSMVRQPPWNTESFYRQAEWEGDLPILNLERIRGLTARTRFVHISGEKFTEQHDRFDAAMQLGGPMYSYIKEPSMRHHWQSGWFEKHVLESIWRGSAPSQG